MKPEHYFSLQPSEMAIFRSAAQIFSGYAASGAVNDENEAVFLKKAVQQSIVLARHIDRLVESDDEMGKQQ